MSAAYHHALRPQTNIQNFKILKILGVGGFGITYQAVDENLDRLVAVKEYFPSSLALRGEDGISISARSESDREDYEYGLNRFLDEAKTLARFRQPNIVSVTQFLQCHNTAYLVMDFEDGETLDRHLKQQVTLSEQEVLNIAIPVLEGLQVVHAENFLHRDIKPANIFICRDGRPVLLDFGAARQAVQNREMTAIVTPGFAPYEQYFNPTGQGAWTDLYAVGATLFYCLTGIKPTTAIERSTEINKGNPDPLLKLFEHASSNVSEELKSIIVSLLEPQPDKRPQSAQEIMEQLARLQSSPSVEAEIEWDDDFLAAVEQVLKDKQVANAHEVVERVGQVAHDIGDVTEILISEVDEAEDKTELLEKTALLATRIHKSQASYSDPDAALPLYEILWETQILLATIIGPQAEDWVAEAARKAGGREDFYEYIVSRLGDEARQQEFRQGVLAFDPMMEFRR